MQQSRAIGPSGLTPHIMMAGDSRDLPALRRILAGLPEDSYGQVFIEIVAAEQMVTFDVPERVTVTWLRRDLVRGSGRGSFGSARGEAIERAVLGWAAEWLEPGCQCGQHSYYVWVGCAMSPSVDRLHVALHTMLDTGAPAADRHTHG